MKNVFDEKRTTDSTKNSLLSTGPALADFLQSLEPTIVAVRMDAVLDKFKSLVRYYKEKSYAIGDN